MLWEGRLQDLMVGVMVRKKKKKVLHRPKGHSYRSRMTGRGVLMGPRKYI